MRWAKKRFIYDATEFGDSPNYKPNPYNKVYGPYTLYESSKMCERVLYSRDSKINAKPAVHNEFKLKSSRTIRKQLGINCLGDLINYNLKAFYENFYKRRISHNNDIDRVKLAKKLLGLSRRKIPEKIMERLRENELPFYVRWEKMCKKFESMASMTEYYRARQRQRWNLAKSRRKDHVESKWKDLVPWIERMKHDENFENASTMLKYFNNMKKEIKRNKGRHSEYEKMILKISFFQFVKPSNLE